MLLVGLHGWQGAGKDTVAGILAERGFERIAFADPMREALYKLDPHIAGGWSLRMLVDVSGWDSVKREYPEVRGLLQRFGTEVGREMWGEDFWVRQGLAQAAGKPRVVVTDVRFENEVAAIKQAGGFMFRVVRPGYGPREGHASEGDLSHLCDRTIDNSGDLEHLRREVGLAFSGMGYDSRTRV